MPKCSGVTERDGFIALWQVFGGNEVGNFESFAGKLVQILNVHPVRVADPEGQNNDYRFARPVTFTRSGQKRRGRIRLCRRGCFVPAARARLLPCAPCVSLRSERAVGVIELLGVLGRDQLAADDIATCHRRVRDEVQRRHLDRG